MRRSVEHFYENWKDLKKRNILIHPHKHLYSLIRDWQNVQNRKIRVFVFATYR